MESELTLFNKQGDLYLKTGRVQEAVDTYERAADLYEKASLPNNAIALCNKILRNAPGRTQIYLKLAKLMLERGFVAEAKKHLLEYADRMQKSGELEEAFRALKEFADLTPDNEEIRLLLAEQLQAAARTDEAKQQLAQLYAEVEATGDQRRTRTTLHHIKAIDPDFDEQRAPKAKVKVKSKKTDDLVFIDLEDAAAAEEPEAPAAVAEEEVAEAPPAEAELLEIEATVVPEAEEPVEEIPHEETEEIRIERASAELMAISDEVETLAGLEGTAIDEIAEEVEAPALEIETTALEGTFETEAEELPSLEGVEVSGEAEAAVEVPELDLSELGEEEAETAPAELEPSADLAEELEAVEVEEEEEMAAPVAAAPDIPTLEAQIAEHPEDPALHRALGEALVEEGERDRGLEELDLALGAAEAHDDWALADDVAEEILRLDPNGVRHHQKRVEYAFKRNDEGRLVERYLSLADALFREGVMERSRAVYERVIELDPENDAAKAALVTLEPTEAPEEAPAETAVADVQGDFVDLGALILGDEEPAVKDTRMRIEEEEPTGDEERDFAEMLAEFKKGIAANVEEEDWEAHYDLGIAFKEMGLLDEAIAELQKALRSPEGRLKSGEALGLCFFEKGQYAVAATVLRRAIETDSVGDEQKIGLLYWLARCEEERGKSAQALEYYQRVFALDINFQDVGDRVKSLAEAES